MRDVRKALNCQQIILLLSASTSLITGTVVHLACGSGDTRLKQGRDESGSGREHGADSRSSAAYRLPNSARIQLGK